MAPEFSEGKIRLDKWLWHARFLRTRSAAAKLLEAGKCRVNGSRIDKPARQAGPGDVLTFPQGARVRVVRILALSEKRGGAEAAQALYEDLSPEAPSEPEPKGPRPDKKDRRAIAALRRPPLE